MNYSRYQEYFEVYGLNLKLFAGYVLVSLGMLLAAAGGSWDITNHLLNKPETFFAPPHAVLYSGATSAVVGSVLVFSGSKSKGSHTGKKMIWPAKMVIVGVVMLISAAPLDFGWHSAFGLDGLLSPPHFVLVSGMIIGSTGALTGLAQSTKRLPSVLIPIAILPVWLAASGMIDMFSLPFSETDYFNFNPHPTLGVIVATLAFPFLISACLIGSSALAGKRFGVLSMTGAAFIIIGLLTSIIPNTALIATIPFYLSSIIPIVAADALLAFSKSRFSIYAAGIIVSVSFLMLYYPLITYTYNEVFEREVVWPSLIPQIYFKMIQDVFFVVALATAAMGILGALLIDRVKRNKKYSDKLEQPA
ncbi:MAG: hypothetical protein M3093_03275 [Thermoproteota archaeon]|nr:hypothetical protein [Thermoproteota archaeon]